MIQKSTSLNNIYNVTFTHNEPLVIAILKMYVLTFTPRLYSLCWLSYGAIVTAFWYRLGPFWPKVGPFWLATMTCSPCPNSPSNTHIGNLLSNSRKNFTQTIVSFDMLLLLLNYFPNMTWSLDNRKTYLDCVM